MVASCNERVWQPFKDTLTIVVNQRSLAMQKLRRSINDRAINSSYRLMTQTHSEDRSLARCYAHNIHTNAGILRSAWTGREQNAVET